MDLLPYLQNMRGNKCMNKLLEEDLIYRANRIYEYFQQLIKECAFDKWYASSLEFEIKDSEEINGKSWCEKDKDHIEINRGVIEKYYNYFAIVMENDKVNFLRHLNVTKEDDELRKMSYEGVLFKDGQVEVYDSKLVDDGKAKLLEMFVSRFIILHELGHILNGHCKLIANKCTKMGLKYIPLYYSENEKLLDEDDALDIRTLEMDADAFAATQSIFYVLFLYENFESQVKIKMEPNDVFYWWSFAVRSHFLMCEDLFMDNKYYKKMTHLPSNARWTLIYYSALEVIDSCNIIEQEKIRFKELITKGAIDAEVKFNCVKYTNYNWVSEIDNNIQYINYRNEVNINWEKLKNQLKEYARLPLFGEM